MSTDVLPATCGTGPLVQRDYWAVLDRCPWTPSQLIARVKTNFCALPPASLVEFAAAEGVARGSTIEIVIKPGQRCGVRVIHEDDQSITLATLAGHPEAGRITFGDGTARRIGASRCSRDTAPLGGPHVMLQG